jgi:hypothetical protein
VEDGDAKSLERAREPFGSKAMTTRSGDRCRRLDVRVKPRAPFSASSDSRTVVDRDHLGGADGEQTSVAVGDSETMRQAVS